LPPSVAQDAKGASSKHAPADISFTSIEDLGKRFASSHLVMGKVLACLSEVVFIELRSQQLPCFRYVLGKGTSVVEVSVVGNESFKVLKQVRLMPGHALKVLKVTWNASRQQLQHSPVTELQAAPECDEQFEDASFPLSAFGDLLRATPWTRISVEGFVLCPGEAGNSRQDTKNVQQWVRDVTIYNMMSQGINLRIVHSDESAMDFLEEGVHIVVKYGKVNGSSGIYADVGDLSQVEATGMDDSMRPDPETVKELSWQQK